MPTPISVGNVSFQQKELVERRSRRGLDSLTVVLRGATSLLAAEKLKWRKGSAYPGYGGMYLEEATSTEHGAVSEIELNFSGFIESPAGGGLIDTSRDIVLSSVQLVSSQGVNVTVSYYSQVTTVRWLTRGAMPGGPRFGGQVGVPAQFPPGALFNPSPPRFKGNLNGSYKVLLRLVQFQATELAPNAYAVTESWAIEVEAA